MSKAFDVAVIGGGIFGALSAIEASKNFSSVVLIERESDIMLGATLNNQNRLHLGYHYPRDPMTVNQCKQGFKEFSKRYGSCILRDFNNYYFISKIKSNINLQQYKRFCIENGLPFRLLHNNEYDYLLKNVEGGILTEESVYDAKILRRLVLGELKNHEVTTVYNYDVGTISEIGRGFILNSENKEPVLARSVINCTYANVNKFSASFGRRRSYQFELTVVPVVRWNSQMSPIGLTLMDGPFFTVLPYGMSGDYLLYHVTHSVFKCVIDESYPACWSKPREIISESHARTVHERIVQAIVDWFPSAPELEFVDYLSTVRVVLSGVDDSDARPSLIDLMPAKFFFANIFSGKIDHSVWLSREVVSELVQFVGGNS